MGPSPRRRIRPSDPTTCKASYNGFLRRTRGRKQLVLRLSVTQLGLHHERSAALLVYSKPHKVGNRMKAK